MAYYLILSLLLALFAWPAAALPVASQLAAPCPTFVAGWGKQWPASCITAVTAVTYDETSLLMYIIWNNTFSSAYYPVPLSVMQTFSSSSNPSQVYNTIVKPSYHAILLEEKDNCPVLQQTYNTYLTLTQPIVLAQNGCPILQEPAGQNDSNARSFILLSPIKTYQQVLKSCPVSNSPGGYIWVD